MANVSSSHFGWTQKHRLLLLNLFDSGQSPKILDKESNADAENRVLCGMLRHADLEFRTVPVVEASRIAEILMTNFFDSHARLACKAFTKFCKPDQSQIAEVRSEDQQNTEAESEAK